MKKIIFFSFIAMASLAIAAYTTHSIPENNIAIVDDGGSGGQSGTINPPPPPPPHFP